MGKAGRKKMSHRAAALVSVVFYFAVVRLSLLSELLREELSMEMATRTEF